MKTTEQLIEGRDPYVRAVAHDDGTISVTLEFYRTKRNGNVDHFVVRFDSLEDWDLACIGQKAREAIDLAGRKKWAFNRAQLKRVTGE
jgi:hypothetical protein